MPIKKVPIKLQRKKTFNKVKNHLLRQMKQSKRSEDSYSCLYRGPGKLKCAVGCLITEPNYSEYLELRAVSADRVIEALKKSKRPTDHKSMVMYSKLQVLHDCSDPSCWKEKLDSLEKILIKNKTI